MPPFSEQPHAKRFTFDTIFEGDAVIVRPRAKRVFTAEDVEAARAEGFAAGERSVTSKAEGEAAKALAGVAQATREALGALTRIAHDHRTASADLALAVGRKIAGAALHAFPEAPVAAALQALARDLEVTPRLQVHMNAPDPPRLEAALAKAAADAGFSGQIVLKPDPGLAAAAFVLDWGDGRAAFDPDGAVQRVTEALQTALIAEGLHADPVLPFHPSEA